MAMGKDHLLPSYFAKISRRSTPNFSILFTSVFMILVILFLDVENLAKTASLLKILLFLFVMFSLIVMRESNIRHYKPKFKSPFYPWIQLVGIIGLIFLIFEMGLIPMLTVGVFILFGFLWYWLYARDKIWREYSLLYVIERITGIKSAGYLIDEELREILIERDDVTEKRFEDIIKECEVVDLEKFLHPDEFTQLVAYKLATRLNIEEARLYKLIKKKRTISNFVVHPGVAIFSHTIKGRDKFDMIIIRSKKGFIVSDDSDPIYMFFIIVASPDQQSFYLHSLMWIIQIAEEMDFEEEWMKAKDDKELKEIILSSWRKRKEIY